MTCYGIPVLTSGKAPYHGKGFTYDTKNKKEYFELVKLFLNTNIADKDRIKNIDLAKKFFLLQHFCYYMETNFFDYAVGEKDNMKLKIKKMEDLLPGANTVLDYICNSILTHQPIISEHRQPPVRVL